MPTKEEILHALQERRNGRKCPLCAGDEWEINEKTAAAMPINENGDFMVEEGDEITPIVQVTCKACGFVASFNIEILGLKV